MSAEHEVSTSGEGLGQLERRFEVVCVAKHKVRDNHKLDLGGFVIMIIDINYS